MYIFLWIIYCSPTINYTYFILLGNTINTLTPRAYLNIRLFENFDLSTQDGLSRWMETLLSGLSRCDYFSFLKKAYTSAANNNSLLNDWFNNMNLDKTLTPAKVVAKLYDPNSIKSRVRYFDENLPLLSESNTNLVNEVEELAWRGEKPIDIENYLNFEEISFNNSLFTWLIENSHFLITALVGLPLLTVLLILIFGRFMGKFGAVLLVLQQFIVSLIITFFFVYLIYFYNTSFYCVLGNWITLTYPLKWSFLVDPLSIGMVGIIEIIGFCVIIYAVEYMYNDPHFNRFILLLSLFIFCMLFLVTSGNFIQFLMGWEGVGIVSYLLVNFWFSRLEANRAAIKAVIFNRIGDLGLILAVVVFGILFKTFEFSMLFGSLPLYNTTFDIVVTYDYLLSVDGFYLLTFFLILAAVGKSAQIGLHSWLPDAMEGPTPVSALLHSATMVTAGIFLLLRFSPVFFYTPTSLVICIVLGSLTAFFSAFCALSQVDIKKIIAFSTCSQLGFMLVSFGFSQPILTFFHLLTHAFFKALLFLSAGVIIHALQNEQDIRRMGGLIRYMPLTFVTTFIGNLALMGFPFLSGFYSKEFILLHSALNVSKDFLMFFLILTILSSFLTVLYSVKTLYYVFFGEAFNGYRYHLAKLRDGDFFSTFSLLTLTFSSIFFGFFILPFFSSFSVFIVTGEWAGLFSNSFFAAFSWLEYELTSVSFKLLFVTFIFIVFSIFVILNKSYINSIYIYILSIINRFTNTNTTVKKIHLLFKNQILFPNFYRQWVLRVFNFSYTKMFVVIERGIFEHIGPLRIFSFFFNLGNLFSLLVQNRNLTSLVFTIIFFPLSFFGLYYLTVVEEGEAYSSILNALVISIILMYVEIIFMSSINKIDWSYLKTFQKIFTKKN